MPVPETVAWDRLFWFHVSVASPKWSLGFKLFLEWSLIPRVKGFTGFIFEGNRGGRVEARTDADRPRLAHTKQPSL